MYKLFNKIYRFIAYGDFDIRVLFNSMLIMASIWTVTFAVVALTMLLLQYQFNVSVPNKRYILFGLLCFEFVCYITIRRYFDWLESEEEKIREKYEYLGKTGAWYDIRSYILCDYTDDDYIKLNEQARKDVVKYQQDRLDKGEIKTLSEFKRIVKNLNVNESDFVNTEHLH